MLERASSTNGAWKTGRLYVLKKSEIRSFLYTTHTQKSSKWIRDINVKLGTIKLLKENRQKNIFFDPSPRLLEIKINKWDLFKIKRVCSAKETIKQKYKPQVGRKYLQMM